MRSFGDKVDIIINARIELLSYIEYNEVDYCNKNRYGKDELEFDVFTRTLKKMLKDAYPSINKLTLRRLFDVHVLNAIFFTYGLKYRIEIEHDDGSNNYFIRRDTELFDAFKKQYYIGLMKYAVSQYLHKCPLNEKLLRSFNSTIYRLFCIHRYNSSNPYVDKDEIPIIESLNKYLEASGIPYEVIHLRNKRTGKSKWCIVEIE